MATSAPTRCAERIDLAGDHLTLSTADATLVFLDREVADPDRPLAGVTWSIDTMIDDGSASSMVAGVATPTMEFGADGSFRVFTTCTTGEGSYPAVAAFLPDRFDTRQDLERVLMWLVGNYDLPIDEIVRITLAIHPNDAADRPCGFVSFGPLPEDHRRREIAYVVHPDWQGRGLATRATSVFIEWVRRHVTRQPRYASVAPTNPASLRVLEKLGFQLEQEDQLGPSAADDSWILRRT